MWDCGQRSGGTGQAALACRQQSHCTFCLHADHDDRCSRECQIEIDRKQKIRKLECARRCHCASRANLAAKAAKTWNAPKLWRRFVCHIRTCVTSCSYSVISRDRVSNWRSCTSHPRNWLVSTRTLNACLIPEHYVEVTPTSRSQSTEYAEPCHATQCDARLKPIPNGAFHIID